MNYEELLIEAERAGLIVKEKPLPINDGRIKGKRIAIRKDIPTQRQKADILAEELGHYYTAVGNILDQTGLANRKQEQAGRLWAYNKRIGLTGIINGYKAHCENRYELAEYLDVSEEFLQEALDRYREKYGIHVTADNYVIIFEPSLSVMEKI